ncbi:MAG: pre-toxin TG domain-containing protein, partial [Pseudobdellovibrionaceae bacterium]|nr:pre-toxin TG domain-containing protein [Pseudobdellovibrionaceae bacterium]
MRHLSAIFLLAIVGCMPIKDSVSTLKDINCPDGLIPANGPSGMQCSGPIVYIDPKTGQLKTSGAVARVTQGAAQDMTKEEVVLAAITPFLPPQAEGLIVAARMKAYRDACEKLQTDINGLATEAEQLTAGTNEALGSLKTGQAGLDNSTSQNGIGQGGAVTDEVELFEQQSSQQLTSFGGLIPSPDDIPQVGQTPEQQFPEQAKCEMGKNLVDHAEQGVEAFKGQPDYEARKGLISLAKSAIEGARISYQEGRVAQGDFLYTLATTAADMAISLAPVVGWGKDIYESWSGTNAVTGSPLTDFERGVAIFGALTGGLGSKLALLAKFGVFVKFMKNGNKELGAAEKLVRETLEAANRMGIKDLDGLKKLAEAIQAPKINPFSLTPTHALTMSKAEFQSLKATMKEDGMLRETIKYVEFKDSKYIVDGHHRA